mmetsp:Transcript_36110/g.58370  ORF Transcript_36110/g.58370 Transcript_36110/m.58370 type:complete len:225 (-) Transcript_36110:228-902(-)
MSMPCMSVCIMYVCSSELLPFIIYEHPIYPPSGQLVHKVFQIPHRLYTTCHAHKPLPILQPLLRQRLGQQLIGQELRRPSTLMQSPCTSNVALPCLPHLFGSVLHYVIITMTALFNRHQAVFYEQHFPLDRAPPLGIAPFLLLLPSAFSLHILLLLLLLIFLLVLFYLEGQLLLLLLLFVSYTTSSFATVRSQTCPLLFQYLDKRFPLTLLLLLLLLTLVAFLD